jgi:hypothetical protein
LVETRYALRKDIRRAYIVPERKVWPGRGRGLRKAIIMGAITRYSSFTLLAGMFFLLPTMGQAKDNVYGIGAIKFGVVTDAARQTKNNVYQIGVEHIPFLPYYETKTGKYKGFSRDFLDAFAKDKKIKFDYVSLPEKRLFNESLAAESDLDFKFPDHEYWAGDFNGKKTITYSDGVVEYIHGVMVLRKKVNIQKDQLTTLGVVQGITPWEYLDDIEKGRIRKYENNDLVSLFKQGIQGQVNGIYINVEVAKYFLQNRLKDSVGTVSLQSITTTHEK